MPDDVVSILRNVGGLIYLRTHLFEGIRDNFKQFFCKISHRRTVASEETLNKRKQLRMQNVFVLNFIQIT